MGNYGQLDPLDLTGVLETDVSTLRTGLFTVKGLLAGTSNNTKISIKDLKDIISKCLEEIQKTILVEQDIQGLKKLNS